MKKDYLILASSIVICLSAGFLGSFFTISAIDGWYETLEKPFFNPPSWIFSPVWTLLYIMMGISLYLLWTHKGSKDAKIIFFIQLTLNALWSPLFFGVKNLGLAFIEIVLLWTAILLTIITSYRVNKTASLLLIPYILWVSFAMILNFSIMILN